MSRAHGRSPHPLRRFALLAVCVAVPLAVGFLGSLATRANIPTWYAGLQKPSFNPPAWVFGPVWTALYVMMGVASYLVVRRGLSRPRVRPATTAYVLQLALNAAWSPVFFSLHSLWGAFAVILALWGMIGVTMLLFRPISRPAFWLMAPYLLWVTYASVLNGTIASMNP